MEDFGVKLARLRAKEDDIIILTFSKDMDCDAASECFNFIKNQYPQYNFLGNMENCIVDITIVERGNII